MWNDPTSGPVRQVRHVQSVYMLGTHVEDVQVAGPEPFERLLDSVLQVLLGVSDLVHPSVWVRASLSGLAVGGVLARQDVSNQPQIARVRLNYVARTISSLLPLFSIHSPIMCSDCSSTIRVR